MLAVEAYDLQQEARVEIGLTFVNPAADEATLAAQGRLLNIFVRDEVHPYYEQVLGLTHVDEEGRPDPDDPWWINFRRQRFANPGLTFCLAQKLDEAGRPRMTDDALVGMAVLKLIMEERVELLEINTANHLRGQGLGGTMLKGLLGLVDSTQTLSLDVARSNWPAKAWYARHGLKHTGASFRHGIFRVWHDEMAAQASGVQQAFGGYDECRQTMLHIDQG